MDRLLKFAAVGASGTLLNLGLFFPLVDRGGVPPSVGSVLCFAAAVTWNYLLDHLWTFRVQTAGQRPSVRRYLRFVVVSLGGLALDLGVLNLVIALLHPELKVLAQVAGIACGVIANYTGSSLFAFRRKEEGCRGSTMPPRAAPGLARGEGT